MSKFKAIKLDCTVVGTVAIMNWCDEHPEEQMSHATFFYSEDDPKGLVASDITEDEIFATLLLYKYETWYRLPNGWIRIHPVEDMALWYCKKGNRIICITD